MSGVYIKDMEMPTSCVDCIFYRKTDPVYDYCCISSVVPKGYVPDDCPLIPVPDHSDLIDRDETMNAILEEQGEDYAPWFAEIVNEMPTIIPADKEEDDG